MKRILIYDDNSQHSKDLSELLKKLLSVKTVIDIANNSDKAMELITANSYAVIFLDIELEDRQSGIDFGKTVRQSCKGTSLVFITSYIKYAEDTFWCLARCTDSKALFRGRCEKNAGAFAAKG